MVKLNAKQLRSGAKPAKGWSSSGRNDIYIILDNVLDTYNVGAIFRLSDAVAVKKLYLCGKTETPPNPRIKKSSINTTEIVDWEYCATANEAISKLKNQISNIQVIAIEQVAGSIPYNKFEYNLPVALVVGNESYGVSEEVLKMADAVVELPMYGVNISLNVMVSLGIVLYQVIETTKNQTG